MHPRLRAVVAISAVTLITSVAALAGCGNDNSDRSGALTSARADTTVSGRVRVTGSSTVQPISGIVGEALRGQNGDVDTSVDGPGTGDGFIRLCAGDADVAGASRPIEEEELEACRDRGIDPIELPIAIDGVAVIAARDNPLACVTFADLYALVGPEAEGIDRWSDGAAVAEELGSTTELPDERLVLTGPGEESGTYDAFLSIVVEAEGERRAAEGEVSATDAGHARPDYASTADDNAIVEAVATDAGGLGWVGLVYAEQSPDVRLLPVARDADGPCVTPSPETVRDGSYPITRDLYIYVAAGAAERPEVAAFVDFYLAGLPDFLELTDFIGRNDAEVAQQRWDDRETLT